MDQRRGSIVTDKGVRMSVLKGRMVEAKTATETIQGYICSLDDYHYAIIPRDDPRTTIYFPKGSTALRVYMDRTLDHEPLAVAEEIRDSVRPFFDKLSKENR